MQKISIKPIIATISVLVLFCGVWYLGHKAGKVVFNDLNSVMKFLGINAALWAFPICLEAIGSNFSFKDHGFQLTLTALVSLVALESGSIIKGFKYEYFFLGLTVILLSLAIVTYIRSANDISPNKLPWGYRLISWAIGVISAEVYLLVSLSEEIVSWSY